MRRVKVGPAIALTTAAAIGAAATAAADPSPESRYLQGLDELGITAEQTSSLLIVGYFSCAERINGANPNDLAVKIAQQNPDLTVRGAALLLNVASTTLCADEALLPAFVPDEPPPPPEPPGTEPPGGGPPPSPRVADLVRSSPAGDYPRTVR